MLYISYGSDYDLEEQMLLAGDLPLIGKGESGKLKKDIAEIEITLKALIKFLKNKSLNPRTLGPSSPIKLEKNHNLLLTQKRRNEI